MTDWLDWLKWIGPVALSVVIAPIVRWSVKRGVGDQVAAAVAPLAQSLDSYRAGHAQEHRVLDNRLHDGDLRFATLDASLRHLPTKDDLEELSRSMAGVHSGVAGLTATVDGIRGAVNGLQETVNMLVQNELKGGRE